MEPFYDKPKNDEQRLFNLQREFLAGKPKALGLMFQLMQTIALKKINKAGEKNPHVAALPCFEREQKAHNAAAYIVEQFLTRPGFSIHKSFGGYIELRVRWELFGEHQKKSNQMVCYNTDRLLDIERKKRVVFLVKDITNGFVYSYENIEELLQKYRPLRKNLLVKLIRDGTQWRKYIFDLMEVDG